MKVFENRVITYELKNEFMVDIIDNIDTFEAWIYKKNMGVKNLMFGVPAEQQTMDEFINIVLENLPEYEDAYTEQWERS